METPAAPPVIRDLSQLDPEGFYTYADYLLWKFQERVELIRGKLLKMSPAPGLQHQQISLRLTLQVGNFFRGKSCQVFTAPFDVRLPIGRKKGQDTTVVQPDLCVVCDPAKLDERGCAGAPDFIIEILSPGNTHREMREKFRVYEASGVREYWMVDAAEKLVWRYVLNEEGVFIGLAPAIEEDIVRVTIFSELEINLNEVFAR